jgi:hypothetical protein
MMVFIMYVNEAQRTVQKQSFVEQQGKLSGAQNRMFENIKT